MIITNIKEYDKKKVLVQIDEHLVFPVYKAEVKKYCLIEGAPISQEIYRELVEEVLSKRVKLRAMKLLEKRPYTRENLKRKLLDGKYPMFLVDEALDYVSSYHYIDDVIYALDYMHCYSNKRSKKQISLDLMRKGISKEKLEVAWSKFEITNDPVDEMEQIKAILSKKHFDIANADYKEKSKMFQYLYRKGYDVNCIQMCMQFEEDYSN